jgi:hypothetical protein
MTEALKEDSDSDLWSRLDCGLGGASARGASARRRGYHPITLLQQITDRER